MNHQLVSDITSEILRQLNLPFTEVKTAEEKDFMRVDIVSPKPSRIIGWHGETLNSVQCLVKAIVRTQEKLEKAPFIVLDTDGYRRMQEDKVRKIADTKADFVRRTGNRIALQPMSPYFRRVVHLHVASSPHLSDLTTESVGEGDYRQIVLRMKKEEKNRGGEELSPVMSQDDGLENLDI